MTISIMFESVVDDERCRTDLTDQLDGCSLLDDLSYSEKSVLAKFMRVYRAPAGSYIFHQGDHGDFLCFVLEGEVEIVKMDDAEHEKRFGVIGIGKTVGEMSLIDGERRSASARAIDQVKVALLTKDNLESLGSKHAPLALKFMWKLCKLVSQRLRQTSGKLVDFIED